MDLKYKILTRVASDRELWKIYSNFFDTVEEAREGVATLMTDHGYRAVDIKIVKEYEFSVKITG